MMEDTNKIAKQKPVEINVDPDQCKAVIHSFTSEGCKRKRKRGSDVTED
jgi:hypothetical protein